jgi:predicted choloylglycine hydrolase
MVDRQVNLDAMATQSINLHAFQEERPGARWRALYDATWPQYRSWYLGPGDRPSATAAESALLRHMPELHPTWQRLVALTRHDPTSAAMLTHWNMPAFAPGCSQVVVNTGARALIRNYDYHPDLFEQVVMSTRFADRKVMGTSDCLWGLLDGMNSDGLAASLTFGGTPGWGPGFGIPLVIRYLLETASTVPDALARLDRLPVSAAYNVTLSDRHGCVRTAYVAPGRRMEARDFPVATNHRFDRPESPAQARRFRTLERQTHLLGLLDEQPHPDVLAEAFLREPLRSTDYAGGFGTLYTADYRPDTGEVHYRWPGTRWTRTFDSTDAELRLDVPAG